jgi:hypothetical protein
MHAPPEQPVRVQTRDQALRLVEGVLATMTELEGVLEHETAHVRRGALREGLSQEGRKTELASAYLRGLEAVKGNAIVLARLAPEALDRLRALHQRFAEVLRVNHTVLATARAVSESLVKSLAEEVGRASRPANYAPPARGPSRVPAAAAPLIVSKSL